MKKTILTAAAAITLAGATNAATIVNGSLNGTTGNGVTPTGWTVSSFSPDTNDLAAPAGGTLTYSVAPGAESNDGATWVGLAAGFGFEGIQQSISDFIVGQTYDLRWEQVNSGLTLVGFTNTNAVSVTLDGAVVGTGAAQALGSTWSLASTSFTATATSHVLGFRLANNVSSYMNIDGITFAAPVPVPAAVIYLLTALGAFRILQRRSQAAA